MILFRYYINSFIIFYRLIYINLFFISFIYILLLFRII